MLSDTNPARAELLGFFIRDTETWPVELLTLQLGVSVLYGLNGREVGDPRCILDLLARIVTVSIESNKIVDALPPLDIIEGV